MSLKARLILAAVYVLTVLTIGLEVPLALTVSKRETQREESRALTLASLLAARINDDLPDAGIDPTKPDPERHAIADLVMRTAANSPPLRYVVVDARGRLVADSSRQSPVGTVFVTPKRPEFRNVFGPNAKPGGDIDVEQRPSDSAGGDLLIVTVPVVHFRRAIGAVRASEPVAIVTDRVHRTWLGYALVGLVAILVGMAATWVLAGTLVRPVRRLEDAAVRLGGGDLDARADPTGPEEIATLAGSFNQMASALSANISAQKDFLANASHQLRTPLTGIRLRLEAIEQEGGFVADQAVKAEGEVDRLAKLVEDLLELARAASVESTGAAIDLVDCCRDAADRWAATAESEGKRVVVKSAAPAPIWAEAGDVNHVLDNLIENAIRYATEGCEVSVEAGTRDSRSFVAVADNGPGISPEDRERIFERFYRGSTGRRAGPGTGLGLAIARELVRRWGGDIRLADGPGTRFEAVFPQRAAAPRPGSGSAEPATPTLS